MFMTSHKRRERNVEFDLTFYVVVAEIVGQNMSRT